MAAKTAAHSGSIITRPAFWTIAWVISWLGARVVLEATTLPTWVRIAAALAPAPLAAVALLTIVREARELDELEKRIQLEALAIAFVLSMLLIMTLGLMELAVTLNRNDWSYRHVWPMLLLFYYGGIVFARKRYS